MGVYFYTGGLHLKIYPLFLGSLESMALGIGSPIIKLHGLQVVFVFAAQVDQTLAGLRIQLVYK